MEGDGPRSGRRAGREAGAGYGNCRGTRVGAGQKYGCAPGRLHPREVRWVAPRPSCALGMMLMLMCQRCPAAASIVGGRPGSGPPLQPVKPNMQPVMPGPQCRRRRRNIPRAVARGAAGALPAPPLAGFTTECAKAGPNTGRDAGWDPGTRAVTASQSLQQSWQQQRAISTASWCSAGHNRGASCP